ncbi:phenol hydroxylase [Phlyctema vagabunda]|uniref:Phenol hydroxylase n=1 Tax=Phlyctema vagabunda TaxID=108571 RepID=A0ABR4PD01_9HELO
MTIKTQQVDVLIIGAGPAGLTAANCFNGSNLSVRLIDKKSGIVETGKADGLKSISLEVLDTFGIGDAIRNEAHRVEEVVLWNVDERGILTRSMTIPDRTPELRKPREISLHQGRIEHHMLSNIQKHGNVQVSWRKEPINMEFDLDYVHNSEAYPIEVSLLDVEEHVVREIIQAKYVIGCDGAHSWTRKQLDISFVGDLADSTWGVMDMVPKTNFPDIRKVFVVHSAVGTVMGVPREDKLVRFYVSIDGVRPDAAAALESKGLSVEHIVDAASTIMAPYSMKAGSVVWWSAYRVGQRVAEEFSRHERVFLAGDAVHTHSPKAGQGMNTSIQDAYNIGWKLRFCLEQKSSRSLLTTYAQERKPVADQLIAFDKKYLKLFANPDLGHDGFLEAYLQAMKFTTGISIQYSPSLIVKSESQVSRKCALAKNLAPGMRIPDFQMVNQSDGVPISAHHRLISDGRFRILVFPGDISAERSFLRLEHFGHWLDTSGLGAEASRARGRISESGLETITIHSAKRNQIELMDLHEAFHPWTDKDGWDYWKVYADDESYHDGHGHLYERCGIDPDNGCVVVLRPDGYTSLICELDDVNTIDSFFLDLL